MKEKIKLAQGAGGELMDNLIKDKILKYFVKQDTSEVPLSMLDDAAVIDDIVFSTDSHTVQPIIFPGGDIGSLAVSGTINDIAVMGAKPLALATGFIADKIGRKKPVIVGLVLLGISYTLVGLDFNPTTFFYQQVFSGLAWGILIVLYTSIPGDFALEGTAERFYAFGVIIPFILYTGINGSWRFIDTPPPIDIFSTILSIALFLSVIPILYSSEPLSESKIKEIKLKDYTKKVSEVVKETKKSN